MLLIYIKNMAVSNVSKHYANVFLLGCVMFLLFVICNWKRRIVYGSRLTAHTPSTQSFFVFGPDYHQLTSTSQTRTIPSTFLRIFKEYGVRQTVNFKDAVIVFLHSLDDFDKLKQVPFSNSVKLIYGIRSINMIASKSVLALGIRSYSRGLLNTIIPRTWVIGLEKDRTLMHNHAFNKDGTAKFPLICKKNIQRQRGLLLVNTRDELPENYMNDYAICQELLLNPYIIASRKINMRIYLLIFVNQVQQRIEGYMYNDGFMYYTPKTFSPILIEKDRHITTGYIDRAVYKSNPLTLQDFYEHIDKKGTRKCDGSSFLRDNLKHLLSEVMRSLHPLLKSNELDTMSSPNRFVIMGCDVAPDDKLNVKLMEINKGPDLKAKDERDGVLKLNMVKDALRICGVLPERPGDSAVDYIKVF